MAEKHIVVAAHGHCFDGLLSAAMFTHLRRSITPRSMRFSYRSCGYGPKMQSVPERWLRGDENAIVDFRYVASRKLTWYFDHHVTGFETPEQRERELAKSKRYHHDASYGSCTKLIADVGRARYGVDFSDRSELIEWAERVDSAGFGSAAEAIDRTHPVMQLACVAEQHGNGAFYSEWAAKLSCQPLDQIATCDAVKQLFRPIQAAQQTTLQIIGEALELDGQVAFADLSQNPLPSSGKFVAYALMPECTYSAALIRMKRHYKISVGFNPWCGKERKHDVASLCRRYGGGGHPFVGAVSLPLDKLDQIQAVLREMTDVLNG